jgi:hypothetical protein
MSRVLVGDSRVALVTVWLIECPAPRPDDVPRRGVHDLAGWLRLLTYAHVQFLALYVGYQTDGRSVRAHCQLRGHDGWQTMRAMNTSACKRRVSPWLGSARGLMSKPAGLS